MQSSLLPHVAIAFALMLTPSNSNPDYLQRPPLLKQLLTANTPAGLEGYSHDAIAALVRGSIDASKVDLLAKRVIKGQALRDKSEQAQIHENDVVNAFNYLMLACDTSLSVTNGAAVHALRQSLRTITPAIRPLSQNQSLVEPTEAVFLLILLITNNGYTDAHAGKIAGDLGPGPHMTGKSTGSHSANISMFLTVRRLSAKQNNQLFSRTLALMKL